MTETLEELLLGDRWAPVTSSLGFLDVEARQAAHSFATWQGRLNADRGITVDARPVSGSLEHVLSALLPLTDAERQRHLFIPTRSPWTAYVDNGWRGTDVFSPISYMAEKLGRRGLRVVAVPHTLRGDKGRFGAVMLEMYGELQPEGHNYIRALGTSNDGGRWVFDASGTPFPFERPEHYKARRVKDRFTFELLRDYLRHLGLSPFDEDFYLPGGAPAWLVERHGPVLPFQKEYSLAQVREELL